jgi:hypothetical protein
MRQRIKKAAARRRGGVGGTAIFRTSNAPVRLDRAQCRPGEHVLQDSARTWSSSSM